jgi:hypothetical protein
VSRANECRLISAANVLGQIDSNPEVLRSVRGGETIRVEVA